MLSLGWDENSFLATTFALKDNCDSESICSKTILLYFWCVLLLSMMVCGGFLCGFVFNTLDFSLHFYRTILSDI